MNDLELGWVMWCAEMDACKIVRLKIQRSMSRDDLIGAIEEEWVFDHPDFTESGDPDVDRVALEACMRDEIARQKALGRPTQWELEAEWILSGDAQ